MRASFFASTIIGLAVALVPGVAALPEPEAVPAAPFTTISTDNSPKPKTSTTESAKYGQIKQDYPVTITVYTTAPLTRGYTTTVTVTKTVTSSINICSSSSTPASESKSSAASVSATASIPAIKQSSSTAPSSSITTATSSAPTCHTTSYRFQILSPDRLSGQYIRQQPRAYPYDPQDLGHNLLATRNRSLATTFTLRADTGHVYDAATEQLGWTTIDSAFAYILPLADNYAGADYGYRYLSCAVTASGSVKGVAGATGALGCTRSDGVVPTFWSCDPLTRAIALRDGSPTNFNCTALTIAAVPVVRDCSSASSSASSGRMSTVAATSKLSTTIKSSTSTKASITTKSSTTTTKSSPSSKPSTTTSTSPPCSTNNPPTYLFRVISSGPVQNQYFTIHFDSPPSALGSDLITTPNITLARVWAVLPGSGHVYSTAPGEQQLGWTAQSSDFSSVLPLLDSVVAAQPSGSTSAFRHLSCAVTPSGAVAGVPGAVGVLACTRADGVVPTLVSCPGAPTYIVQQDDTPNGMGCTPLTVAAISMC